MHLDELMPAFDATRIETRVIDAPPGIAYDAALRLDLLDVVRGNPLVKTLFALRAAAERVISRTPPAPEPEALRLRDLGDRGEWVRLADDPPREFAFGVVGRFWGGETRWEPIEAQAFTAFDRPGFAKIAAAITLHPYGTRTLMTYEARTLATDAASRRAFLRYWRVVSPGVGIVMRATLAATAEAARRGG